MSDDTNTNITENFVSFENMQTILDGIADKLPMMQTQPVQVTDGDVMYRDVCVGFVTWQPWLMDNFLKLDGADLYNASEDYAELLAFAHGKNLVTEDVDNRGLFKYNELTDVLTVPDLIGLCLQGGNAPASVDAGLPNITGQSNVFNSNQDESYNGAFSTSVLLDGNWAGSSGAGKYKTRLCFDASKSSTVYGKSETVQPPAVTLIPQVKYRSTTTVVPAGAVKPLTDDQVNQLIANFGRRGGAGA